MPSQAEYVYLLRDVAASLPDDLPHEVLEGGIVRVHAALALITEEGWVRVSAIPPGGSRSDSSSWITLHFPPTAVAAIVGMR